MPDLTEVGLSRIVESIFNEGDLLAAIKIVEVAVAMSDNKDTTTVQKNIDAVIHHIKTVKSKLGIIKKN